MPTWQQRLKRAEDAALEGARLAAKKAEEVRQKAEPALRDAVDKAKPVVQDAVDKAKPVVQEQTQRGRAAVDAKLDERKAKQVARASWFRDAPGPVYTAGYPDQEAMREGIQAASEHGWRVESTASVPEKRRIVGGLTVAVAKQAADRVLKPDRFLVTFRKTDAAPVPGTPAPGDATPDIPAPDDPTPHDAAPDA